MINFLITFAVGLSLVELGFFLWWRLYTSTKPCRTQHYTENRRIDGADRS